MTALLPPLVCSCATPIKEETFYTDAGEDGAIISHFYDPNTSVIGKQLWDSMREGMTCESGQAIGDIKQEFEVLCSKVSCAQAPNLELLPVQVSPKDMADIRKVVYSINEFFRRLPHARVRASN